MLPFLKKKTVLTASTMCPVYHQHLRYYFKFHYLKSNILRVVKTYYFINASLFVLIKEKKNQKFLEEKNLINKTAKERNKKTKLRKKKKGTKAGFKKKVGPYVFTKLNIYSNVFYVLIDIRNLIKFY